MKILVKVKGGPGSGNWGHAGRPGLRGGSGGVGGVGGPGWVSSPGHPSAPGEGNPKLFAKPEKTGGPFSGYESLGEWRHAIVHDAVSALSPEVKNVLVEQGFDFSKPFGLRSMSSRLFLDMLGMVRDDLSTKNVRGDVKQHFVDEYARRDTLLGDIGSPDVSLRPKARL